MHIAVLMKQVIDLEQLRIRPETRQPVLDGLPVILSTFEKHALEAAVAFKEADESIKITVVASGSGKLKDTIKEALAMGADEAVLLMDEAFEGADAAGSAAVLAAAVERLADVDLVLLGEGSDDEYTGQVPSRVAEILGWPQMVYAREIDLLDGGVRVAQDWEDELEVVEADLPAVVSVTSELNEPRLPPLTAILKAASKPIHEWAAADLGVTPEAPQVEVLSNLAPEQSRKGEIYEDVDEGVEAVVKALRHEGVLE